MKLRVALFVYNLLFPVALVLLLPRLLLRMIKRGNYRRYFGQRFGIYDAQTRARFSSNKWIWVHSISVGETFVAMKLADKIKAMEPNARIVISVTTSTGFAQAEKQASEWLQVIYNPIDLPPIVHRALAMIRPTRIIFVEGIWPNLLAQSKRQNIPAALIARLSERSEKRFSRWKFLTTPIFQLLDLVCVQEDDDIARWTALGVNRDRIKCTGSIKFDHAPKAEKGVEHLRELVEKAGLPRNARILVGGSTFPGEEKILGSIFNDLRGTFPDLFLVIVPRHVERAAEIASDLRSLNINFCLRTDLESANNRVDCILVNTTGELRDWYGLGTVNFIGKSLTAVGGQNPVEAVVSGAPVIFGPHMQNFAAIVRPWLQHEAAIQVRDPDELKRGIARLLADNALRERLVQRALEVITTHQGATERTARLIVEA
jgi:3-deoxy-D-manno-octulosonic-acid transferase